ncbi:MAG: cyclopropane-fatty-acyl-phospholipid synthase family protein [Actinomycetota bacterium]|nr:cyclopropane-fatty-acyl-phospholipid synthase family protein [Actinomycetota bacterium]
MRRSERACRRIVFRVLSRIKGGCIVLVEPDGRRFEFGDPATDLRAEVRLNSYGFHTAFLRGNLGLAEAYRDGVWDTDDPVALARIGCRNLPGLDAWRQRLNPVLSPFNRAIRRVPRNSRKASRRHISAHYDLGNDLFALFLDESMMYSSAWFPHPEATLAEAQEARLDRVCHALDLGPDDHLLEIGTGWGGLAVHAATRSGCRVTTTTISAEQRDGALRRIADAGVSDRVTVLLDDYRDLRGRYDKLVSIEMIEAVGWQYFDAFFRKCSDLLSPDGLMFLQAITIDDRAYEVEKAAKSFANTLIFPGGCLPSTEVIQRSVAGRTDMSTVWLDDISPHYAETLRIWQRRFLENSDLAAELGYDEPFQRAWMLWLAMSEAGFRERRLREMQMLFAKPESKPPLKKRYGNVGAAASSI